MSNINTILMESETGRIELEDFDLHTAWKMAMDIVDYPVEIHPAFYGKDDTFNLSKSVTNTGRESLYQFVIVDKLRNGNFNPIACVTDTYGTIRTADVYNDLKSQLDSVGINYSLKSIYVSGNGGSQLLNVEINGLVDFGGVDDRISIIIQLSSSVDGTKTHTIGTYVYNKDNGAVFDFSGRLNRLSAKHTTSLKIRTIDFVPSIRKIVSSWNDEIIPLMIMMRDCEFDRDFAMKIASELCEDSKLGDRHTSNIMEIIGSKPSDHVHNLYDVNNEIGAYIASRLKNRVERQHKAILDSGKAIRKAIKKYVKK